MKKYRQILAGFLAMNLTISGVMTDTLSVRANEGSYSSESMYSEESVEKEDAANLASEYYDEEDISETESTVESDIMDDTDIVEDTFNSKNIEEIETEEEQVLGEETDATESESETENAENTAVFQDASQARAAGQITLDMFGGYDKDNNSITITTGKQLILLSYCDPQTIQNLTINLNITGSSSIAKENKINSGDDISVILGKNISTENGEISVSDNAEVQTESAAQDSNIENSESVEQKYAEITDHEAESEITAQEEVQDTESSTEENKIDVQNLVADHEYTYQGLGSEDYPFQGTLNSSAIEGLTADNTIFKGLSSSAEIDKAGNLKIKWTGDGTIPMLTEIYQFDDSNEHELPLKFEYVSGKMGSLIGTVKGKDESAGTLTITNSVTYGTKEEQTEVSVDENAGLICGALEAGTIKLDGYEFPQNGYSVISANRNAGGLIGKMDSKTALEINQNREILKLQVSAKTNAGGVVGEAENVTFIGEGILTISGEAELTQKDTLISGKNVGGFIGHYIISENNRQENVPKNIKIENSHVQIKNGAINNKEGGNAGGYFGYLEMQSNVTYTIKDAELNSYYENSNGYSYGAIAGRVTSTDIKAALVINKVTVNSYFDNNISHHGGLIGEIGIKGDSTKATYLDVSDVTVTVYNPYANVSDMGFGGLVGRVCDKSILKVSGSVTVSTSSKQTPHAGNKDPHIWEGGGLVGGASSGSVIEISGTTDLSGVNYTGRFSTGQLVGEQDGALIYARGDGNGNGWTFKRSSAKNEVYSNVSTGNVNDIGNYGEIIRLKAERAATGLDESMITINEDHKVIFQSLNGSWSGEDITINSTEEFALLSIAINSRGTFCADNTVTNYKKLFGKNITLATDVDLTGTGILGLTRDNSGEETFTGNLDGKNNSITLDTGTAFGYRGDTLVKDDTYGSGKLYAYKTGNNHNAQGIFAKSNGNISNLTVEGKLALASDRGDGGRIVEAGGIAAELVKKAQVEITNVKISNLKICAEISSRSDFNSFSVGGLYGRDDDGDTNCQLTLAGASEISPEIKVNQADKINADTKIYAGGILGQIRSANFKLTCENMSIGGTIESNVSQYAYMGGLVGVIQQTNGDGRWIEIKKVSCNGLTIKAPNAEKVCGGLFGAVWAKVHVYFENATKDTKLTVKEKCSINAPKAESVGGLVYRSSGLWEIQDNGIDIQTLDINAKTDVGLLVCRGEYGDTQIGGTNVSIGALYLRMTANWENAYKLASVNIEGNAGVFDEFVAHTADTEDEITDNDKNGVISLATKDRIGVAEDNSCTTYKNRTEYGKQQNANGCSRYYYDLDEYLETVYKQETKNNNYIDTEEELILWSVYRYAYDNIKKYFYTNDDAKNSAQDCIGNKIYTIGPASGNKTFDMRKYSYYPINLSTNIVVRNSTFVFYNQNIEEAEFASNNKITRNKGNITQHYTMHCGLFLNNRATQYTGSITTTVNNVTFKGSVGRLNTNGNSGVLFAGTVNGSIENNVPYTVTVKLTGITLNGIKVTDYETEQGYAPLLINMIRDYTNLEVSGVKTLMKAAENQDGYNAGEASASSLIGNVGTNEGNGSRQMNLSFLNIQLPDKNSTSGEGIFTHATLLESFQYDSASVATYNFYKSDDQDADGKNDHHNVTYGREISNSLEYEGVQEWYYDEEGYGESSGLVLIDGQENQRDFSSYLPYVHMSYNSETLSHEIKVNQRVYDIIKGCGTYGHPYEITSEGAMDILSEYLSTGNARKDWRVRVVNDQTSYCTGDDDIILQYGVNDELNWQQVRNDSTDTNKENWVLVEGGKVLDNSVMHRYLLNAYYDLQGKKSEGTESTADEYQLKLTDFSGFGTALYPFRGVLTSSTNAALILEGAGTCRGLIPYSYGSVIKNLKISYSGKGITLTKNSTKNVTSDYFPDICFGGVIGCVLGGDNIIDNVSVSMSDNWLTLAGEKKHLIQVGGYVGSVCGGGVIFRSMTDTSGLTDKKLSDLGQKEQSRMYVNPYVGRVMDGFAFNESNVELNNTDRNYKINTLKKEKSINVTDENTISIENAQGLLILSAIVNSGAASAGNSNAYLGTVETLSDASAGTTYRFGNGGYGKVRNGAYDHIGDKQLNNQDSDFILSQSDDQKSPGNENLPYLIKTYGVSFAYSISNPNDSVSISLKENLTYDMTSYGTAYQGIAARYVTNALLNEKNTIPKAVIPKLTTFSGSNATVIVNVQVREYEDDDFHAASVGGIFNLLDASASCTVTNLTIESNESSNGVSLVYYGADGSEKVEPSSEWNYTDKNGNVYTYKESIGVGGFAGGTTSVSAGNTNSTATAIFNHVKTQNMTVNGPIDAGGLLGHTGRMAPLNLDRKNVSTNTPIKDIAILIQPESVNTVGVTIQDCSYSNLEVYANTSTGGFVGSMDGVSDVTSELTVTSANNGEVIVGQSSSIGKNNNSTAYAGGIAGYVKNNIKVNNDDKCGTAVLQNVKVAAKQYAGGFFGMIDGKQYQINLAIFRGNNKENANVSAIYKNDQYISAGGIVGEAAGSGNECRISNCRFEYADINNQDNFNQKQEGQRNGGIAGYIRNAGVKISGCTVQNANVYGSRSGGIVGGIAVKTVIENSSVLGGEEEKSWICGTKIAGGIIGISSVSSSSVRLEKCKVQNMKMQSFAWGTGGIVGDVDYNSSKELYLFDCAVQKSEIQAMAAGATAGGISGTLRNKMAASNVLLSDLKISNVYTNDVNKVGVLIGVTGDKNIGTICVSGLSLQNVSAKKKDDVEVTDLYGVAASNKENVKKNSYFAFADYFGSSLTADAEDTTEVFPYVVTRPKSLLKVSETEGGDAVYLYGDGAFWTSTQTTDGMSGLMVNAQKIFNDANAKTEGRFAYENTGVETFDFAKLIATYNKNQSNEIKDDFPVLQVTAGNTAIIGDYLDILTNGGFSAANKMNTSAEKHLTANVNVYKNVKGSFVKSDEDSSLNIVTDTSNKINFETTTEYDNDKDRFTLLTVTFLEKDEDGNEHKYNLQIPIIVRRMLEIDFTATLNYGTDFLSKDYEKLSAHVLESFGSSITGYLTYTYNSAENVYTDYGWQSYIDAGGDVEIPMSKNIEFKQNKPFPVGTQLSLVDCQNGGKVYYYETKENDKDTIPFTVFTDTDGQTYTPQSIGELMGATVSSEGGNFIKTDEEGKPEDGDENKDYSAPTVRIKNEKGDYEYYRLADKGEIGKYSIIVDEEKLHDGTKSLVQENYYLVITVPKNSTNDARNGSVQTSVDNDIPHQIHYRRRDRQDVQDDHENTASTYQLSEGYQQKLQENLSGENSVKKLSTSDSIMTVDVINEITFPNDQRYQNQDKLYQRFVGSLQKTVGGQTNAEQFPSGTSGIAEFYVYTKNGNSKTYYIYNGSWSKTDTEREAVEYSWTSTGGNMELPISTDGSIENAISLDGVRDLIKGNMTTGESTFYIELKMKVNISAAGLDVIPESNLGTDGNPEDYVKLSYTSQLSTVKDSLSYSSNRTSYTNTYISYYRDEPAGAKLTYEADEMNQLGINLLDLQPEYLDKSKTHTLIDTTAVYDLSTMKNVSDVLKTSSGIHFTLTLLPKKQDKAEEYGAALQDASNYLNIGVQDAAASYDKNGTWSWMIPKDSYWSDDQIKVSDIFDGTTFRQSIQLKVKVTGMEEAKHLYSNYKVVLTAEILGNNGSVVENTTLSDNIIYTFAKIKPEFVS